MTDPVQYPEEILKLARDAVAARVSRDGRWFFIAGKGDHFAAVQASCAVIDAERKRAAGVVETLIESLNEGLMTDEGLSEADIVAMKHQLEALQMAADGIHAGAA